MEAETQRTTRRGEVPTDCYACWLSGEDYTDGEWCYKMERAIRWFRERSSKPLDCPLGQEE